MKLASLILDIPTQSLDSLFTYRVPEGMEDARVGCAVLVPFGHRRAIGFIVGIEDVPVDALSERGIAQAKLKDVESVQSRPYFDEDGAACALYMARRCIAPLSTCIRLFTPPGGVPRVVKGRDGWRVEQPEISEVDDRFVSITEAGMSFTPRNGATRQQAVLDALRNGELRIAELNVEFGSVASTIKALESKGVVKVERRRRDRGAATVTEGTWAYEHAGIRERTLTDGQEQALAAIAKARQSGQSRVVLLDGVTGSGKTEVYLQAIRPVLAEGKRVLVLVPEISLTPQTVARFRGRYGDRVAVMHSRMSRGERYDQWDFIRSGGAKVVVGARSALFTPISDIGMIIIDEEHESSYKQDSAPRYHARNIAWWMAKRSHAVLVLGSATPSIESLYACDTRDDWQRVEMPYRVNGRPLPTVEIVDMAVEFRSGSRSMFSRKLVDALESVLRRGEKAMLLLNQRGFARFVLCRDCGYVPECPHCATSLTFHEYEGLLMCHHCGHAEVMPSLCPSCGSPYLKLFGAGTQRVEAELRVLVEGFGLGDVRIVRMDSDTTRKKGAHQELLERFMSPGAAVLLGTQMIAKGLDFDDVTLVGVINADTVLKVPDYRSAEATYDLLEQVSGRAGRAALEGRVVVQTYCADHSAIRAVAAHDRSLFLRDEMPKREALRYPPFTKMADVVVWGKDLKRVRCVADEVHDGIGDTLRTHGIDDWAVFPATPCPISRVRGAYRWHIVIRTPIDADISGVLTPYFRQRKPEEDVRVAIDIDEHLGCL